MRTLEEMAAEQGREVVCAKLGEKLPAVPFRPFENELGDRIYDSISLKAWREWIEHSKLIVNENRLDLTQPRAHELLLEQCEKFLFGEGAEAPKEFVPESSEQSGDSPS